MVMIFLGLMICFCIFFWCGGAREDHGRRLNYARGPPRPRVPTQGMINALPVEIYKKPDVIDESSNDHSCVICLDEYEDGDEVRVLKCGHKYHKDCIDTWLKNSVQCPFCKRPIDTHEFDNRAPMRAARVSPRPVEAFAEGGVRMPAEPASGEATGTAQATDSAVATGTAQVIQAL